MSSPHFLRELQGTFARHGQRPAVVHAGRTYSYAELEQRAASTAGLFQRLGLAPGERVALWTPAKLPFLFAHLGVLWAGGVSLPLNPRYTRAEMRHFLKDSGARLAVVNAEQAALLETLRADLPDLRTVVTEDQVLASPAADFTRATPEADDPCLLVYSSGTTGWPKGVVHTHANTAAGLGALRDCWRFTPDDVVVNVLPLFHIHGLSFATQMSLLTGCCVILEDSFDVDRTLGILGQATVFMAVPTIYYRFLEHPGFVEAARGWQRVRLYTCGSAPIRADVLPRLEQVLGHPVINRYGMSEAFVITSLPLDGPWPHGSVGLPLKGVQVRVVGDGPGAAEVSPGTVGRVQVRGPNLFREYWQQPEATRQAFASGWFDTGDLGMLDAAGFLTLVGRSNDLIITNGFNVYPQVVERALNACPGVRECAVLGVPDERRGERVVAAVVRDDPTLDEQTVQAFLSDRLVDYQRPRTILFVDDLPRNAMGKVLRTELRERMCQDPR